MRHLYSRFVQPLVGFLNLGSWVGWALSGTGLTGAVLIAWASTTWDWYWSTLHWAGIAIAFLLALLVFALCAFLFRLTFPSKAPMYLKEAFVYSGSSEHSLLPRYWAKLARGFDDASVYVDYQYFIGPAWTQPTRITLSKLGKMAREQTIDLVLMSSFEREGNKLWRWGHGGEPADSKFY
jgi:hypothetical protein